MSTFGVPGGVVLNLLSEIHSTTIKSVGEAGSNLFNTLQPPVVAAWNATRNFVIAHPRLTTGLVTLVLALLFAQPFARGILDIVGFGVGGVQAGSIAAGFQSSVHGGFVPLGSLFASLQSLGALL